MKRHLVRLAGALAVTLALASQACPIEHAHYRYSAGHGKADFLVVPQLKGEPFALAFHISLEEKRDLWFLFDQGSSRDVSLISVIDPRSPGWHRPDPDGRRPMHDQRFVAWNDDLKIRDLAPQAGASAPKFILVPDLAETMRYSGSGERMMIGLGIFRMDRCDR